MNRLNCEPHQRKTKLIRLPYNLRQATRECFYFRSRYKNGGCTIRSAISENPMLHANFTAMPSIPELLPIEVLRCRNIEFRVSLLLWPWPWPWPDELHIWTWLVSPEDIPAERKMNFTYVQKLSYYMETDIQSYRHNRQMTPKLWPRHFQLKARTRYTNILSLHGLSEDRKFKFCIRLPAGQAAPLMAACR